MRIEFETHPEWHDLHRLHVGEWTSGWHFRSDAGVAQSLEALAVELLEDTAKAQFISENA